ncbi:hypothetical protein D1B33_07880 [Lysinibacillus yapensis]|uniref:Uncharacterized protein n=1 Tax=Ureibacillus yapensis TaxID=2304605 RepID=A0A396S928_9BACL|nr:hypothetical protein [Lysinibacillus yapensis]RHW37453.1 hypothetical protein D1B33_07880 [Lysinibacillus yapensis]
MNSTQPTNVGQNISNSIYVLKETYKNLNLLFSELDRIAEKEGFIPLTPKFLRWKSDSNYNGWLTSNFIKLYQIEKDPPLKHIQNLKEGFIYGIEVDLEGEDNYPIISLSRYQFDFSEWFRIPTTSDHWIFWDPFRKDKFFEINKVNDVWISKTLEKSKIRYWGMQNAVSIEIPLVSITSSEEIRSKIFLEFNNLPSF